MDGMQMPVAGYQQQQVFQMTPDMMVGMVGMTGMGGVTLVPVGIGTFGPQNGARVSHRIHPRPYFVHGDNTDNGEIPVQLLQGSQQIQTQNALSDPYVGW